MAPSKREKPDTKECQDEEQVSPTVAEFHAKRRVELVSDLQNGTNQTFDRSCVFLTLYWQYRQFDVSSGLSR